MSGDSVGLRRHSDSRHAVMSVNPGVRKSPTIAPDHPDGVMKILHVVGARPNFPKLAPVFRAACAAGIAQVVIHTGQHYDDVMSASLFRDLAIREPDVNLGVHSASHAVQTARVIERLEPILIEHCPNWVVVYGDVNSTMAAALVAAKLGIPVAHVEAGLRSYDLTMPEEINRIVTDRLANLLLTPSRDADAILRAEGEPADEIVFVGNVMIDSLLHALPAARALAPDTRYGLTPDTILVTLHRPSNVDHPDRLLSVVTALREIARTRPVLFPAHPRTLQRLAELSIDMTPVRMMEPIPYLEMAGLMERAYAVITDSGGVQEETTALGIPCLTVRPNTERPITISEGTNRLVPDPADLPAAVNAVHRAERPRVPEGWDGRAGERIVRALIDRHAARPAHAAGRPGETQLVSVGS